MSTGEAFVGSEEFRILQETEVAYNKRLAQNKIDARAYEADNTDEVVDFIRLVDANALRWYHQEIARRLDGLDELTNRQNTKRDGNG
jgi:hypothetical protein